VTVQERVGRSRYIAFAVVPPVDKTRLLAALRTAPGPDHLRLVKYDGTRGLVECAHVAKDATIAFLNGLRIGGSGVRTTGTSGTIRKAQKKYLAGREPREPST
jgi:RNase P/RNase MRP subunit POP5